MDSIYICKICKIKGIIIKNTNTKSLRFCCADCFYDYLKYKNSKKPK